MHVHLPPRRPAAARLARTAARSLRRAAARLYRAARALEHHEPPADERQYARSVLATYGKLD